MPGNAIRKVPDATKRLRNTGTSYDVAISSHGEAAELSVRRNKAFEGDDIISAPRSARDKLLQPIGSIRSGHSE